MSMFSRIRQACFNRYYSTIPSLEPSTPLPLKDKTKAALALIKTEKNPELIIEICRAASLNPEARLDRIAFSVAISKLSKSNHFEVIRQFLEELKTRPDLKNERFASHAIILYGQANMIDHAIRSFKQMEEVGVTRTVNSLNALLLACILAKDYKHVSRIFLEFPRKYGIEPNLDTYNYVLRSFCESGSSSSGYSTLAEMDGKSIKPNATTLGILLAGFYKEEKFEDVGKVLTLMEKYGVHPGLSTYNIRIQCLCKLKKSSEAKALLIGMMSRGIKPDSVTYHQLILGFCREGNLHEAKSLLEDMKKRGCEPNADCYFSLVYFFCEGGDFEAALRIYKESMEKDWVPNFTTMKKLVNGLASISKVDDARKLVEQIKGKFPKNRDQWDVIEAGLPH